MAVIKRGKNKNKPYTVRYHHEGRQRERSFRTAKEARDFMAKFEHDSREHIFVDPKIANTKFEVAAKDWLSRHTGTPKTKQTYELVLRRYVNPVFGGRGLAAVARDRDGVTQFLREGLPARGLSTSTMRTCYLVINAVINDAIKTGKLSQTRIRGIRLPQVSMKTEITFATVEQIEKMAAGMTEPYGFTIYLMRGCGLRLGEALGVTREDIHDGTLRLARQAGATGDIGPMKHRGEDDFRDIPVPQFVLDAMPGTLVWCEYPATNHRTYRSWFNAARDAAGLPKDFTPHTLRHQFASVCLAGGIPITDVSKWLGHRSIQVTYAIYGHLVPASWDRARNVLDEEWAA